MKPSINYPMFLQQVVIYTVFDEMLDLMKQSTHRTSNIRWLTAFAVYIGASVIISIFKVMCLTFTVPTVCAKNSRNVDMVSRTQRKRDHNSGEMLNLWALLPPICSTPVCAGWGAATGPSIGAKCCKSDLTPLCYCHHRCSHFSYWHFHTVFAHLRQPALAGCDCVVWTPGKKADARSL